MHLIYLHILIERKRNEPERVTLVAQQIADLRDMTYEEVCRQTTENAERLFNLN